MGEPWLPGDSFFVHWIHNIEKLKGYALFGAALSEKYAPFFYSCCDRLCDPDDDILITANRYFAKNGQYSESWSKHEAKKKDLLLRIIRLLNQCEAG
jgi:hypothetical protein